MRVLLIGAGGHGRVVADILLRMQEAGHDLQVLGFLDDKPEHRKRRVLGLPVLGAVTDLSVIEHDAVIVAIGDNHVRVRIYKRLQAAGEQFISAIHPRSIIAPDVLIGPGSMICAGAIVNPGSTIGANVILNTGCTVDHDNRIADHVHIAPGCHLGGEVVVGEEALVGMGANVLLQRRIGALSVVGAGAVVLQDVPPATVVVGVPARPLRQLDPTGDSHEA